MEHQSHPIPATESKASIFGEETEQDQFEREQHEAGIRKARNALFFAGGIMFVVDLIMALMRRDEFTDQGLLFVIGFDAAILAAFIGLGLWTKKKPYTAILVGLILFCVIQGFAMVTDPTNIYRGIILKVAVIAALVSGMKKAKALQDMDRFRNVAD